ncbi:MAG: hypothetical protein ABL958_08365 [Bdellovibrionia bacterium]
MPRSADLPAIKKTLGADGGSVKEAAFWSSWDDLKTQGVCWPLAVFILQDGVGLQLHFQPSREEFGVFIETSNGHEFMRKMKEDWHAET